MIPARFAYERPPNLEAALVRLSEAGAAARPIAGGQSLLPLMKLRLARPEWLIDIGRLEELRGVRELPEGGLAIGSLTTWADLLANPTVMGIGALADAVPLIGDVQIRNRGTLGGSLAHADPAADIAAPMLALGAAVEVRSVRGARTIAIEELFLGPFQTSLEPDELITEIHLPPASSSGGGSSYVALPQPASGYPIAGVAVVLAPATGDEAGWAACRIGVTGVGETPYRATGVEAAVLAGTAFADAAASISEAVRVASDLHADREYRAAMAVVMVRRALDAAAKRPGRNAGIAAEG
jgi:carbon-monoxide dehydrogenase medium subunit